MTLPAGATVSSPRSSSGTVLPYKTGQIIWRPNAPIKVVAGTRLSIPVVGIYYNQPGTTGMWLVASNAAGDALSYAVGNFLLDNPTLGCQATGNNYIQTENAKAGAPKSQWEISPSRFVPTTFSGYANADSYKCGDLAYLKVDSQLTGLATAKVYRMGYYGGTGAREVWSTADYFLTGKQPAAVTINTTNPTVQRMADASNWHYNLAIRIDGRFTPGAYLTKLTDRSGRETYVPFTVRDETGVKHAYLLQQATTTWQAYNTYGGHSFYSGVGGGSSHISFNRPYAEAAGKGSGEYLQLENGLVYWMEQNGYDVAYWTDTDLHTKPTQISSRARNLIMPAHDEYYSYAMRSAVVTGIGTSVNLVSLGANQMHRPIIFNSSNRVYEVQGKITGGYPQTTFRSRGPAYAEQGILGAQYGCRSYGTVIPNSSWMFSGVPAGTALEGFANGETDNVNTYDFANKYNVPKPAGNTVLASAKLDFCTISYEPLRMDIVARTTPAGTRVFGGSSFAYACFLNNSCYTTWPGRGTMFSVDAADSAAVSRILTNVLRWADTGATQ